MYPAPIFCSNNVVPNRPFVSITQRPTPETNRIAKMTNQSGGESKLELGVCYYPEQWPRNIWRDDAKRMVDLGLDWVRISEFSWSNVEPQRGQFHWEWLDEAVEILGSAGLKIMMCTPTAAPPKWLVDECPEILPVDSLGQTRKFGSRRHYCFSSEVFRSEAARITTLFAERYGKNKFVRAWQIDNEFGDHDTILSYSESARRAFREWLSNKYENIESLNEAWGTTFWSARYSNFKQIDLPSGQVEEPNPGHAFDFARFSSDQVIRHCEIQCGILRRFSPNRPISHNFMANSFEFDHFELARHLDFATWDSYPLGSLIHGSDFLEEKTKWLRTGTPDYQGFHSELYRSVGRGRVWITEQQPGPVNWADHNPSPADGVVRNWTWQAWAHGVDVVIYFRWRQSNSGQEQFHSALLLPDGSPSHAFDEIAKVAADREFIGAAKICDQSPVALVVDYPSRWAQSILPQGRDWSGTEEARLWYRAVSELGVRVDVIGPKSDIDRYNLVLCPDMVVEDRSFVDRLRSAQCKVVLGARSGSKTRAMAIPPNLPPGAFSDLVGVRVTRVESLPSFVSEPVEFGGRAFHVQRWLEAIVSSDTTLAHFTGSHNTGAPAIVGNDKCRYLACLPREAFLNAFMRNTLSWAGVRYLGRSEDLRLIKRGHLNFAFNYGRSECDLDLPAETRFIVGSNRVPSNSMAVW